MNCRLTQIVFFTFAAGAPAMDYARPYLIIRAFAFLPSLISVVGFSAFRGVLCVPFVNLAIVSTATD